MVPNLPPEPPDVVICFPWGSFTPDGWLPNLALTMSPEEQCRQNNANGYACQLPTDQQHKELK